MKVGDAFLVLSPTRTDANETLINIDGVIIGVIEKAVRVEWGDTETSDGIEYRAWIPKSVIRIFKSSDNYYEVTLAAWVKLTVTSRIK